MQKRFVFLNTCFYLLITLVILTIIAVVSAAVGITREGHSASNLLITKDGHSMTLQQAMGSNAFIHGASESGILTLPIPGHDASEIWVSVNGNEMTFQDALSTEEGLCGMSSPTASYTSPDIPNPSHLATEIEIVTITNFVMTLQDVINSGDFCYDYSWEHGDCSKTCGGGEWDVWCERDDGETKDDRYCLYSPNTEPSTKCNTHACYTYRWIEGGWSYCQDCAAREYGNSPYRTRDVWCRRSDGARVDDGFCSGKSPHEREDCECHWERSEKLGCRANLYPPCTTHEGKECFSTGRSGWARCSGDNCGMPKTFYHEMRCQ